MVHIKQLNSSLLAIERTYLSHLRLGVVLALLSASILLNARLPNPDGDRDPTGGGSQLQGLGFGSLYFVAALAALFGGLFNYDKLWSGMKSGRAFVQSPKSVSPLQNSSALVLTESILFTTDFTLLY